ncbi:hypothetical protein LSAT2_007517 [Lamellibrachia satsuma]|nr:hypothetical protein LSAT2_007517 [Lamellibrachia satsuma]
MFLVGTFLGFLPALSVPTHTDRRDTHTVGGVFRGGIRPWPYIKSWYVETATPLPKDIVIVFDRSESMDDERMRAAKESAKTLIGTLNPNHRIGVVAFSDVVVTPPGCYSEELAFAAEDNTDVMFMFLDSIKAEGSTDYVEALRAPFQLLEKSENVILFLTDGGALKEDDVILERIADFNEKLSNEFVILTYGIGKDLDESAKDLLVKMARQTKSDPAKGNVTDDNGEDDDDDGEVDDDDGEDDDDDGEDYDDDGEDDDDDGEDDDDDECDLSPCRCRHIDVGAESKLSHQLNETGEETFKITEVLSRRNPRLEGVKSVTVTATYDWRPVSLSCIPSGSAVSMTGTSFSVCIVVPDDRIVQSRGFVTAKRFVNHVLDL